MNQFEIKCRHTVKECVSDCPFRIDMKNGIIICDHDNGIITPKFWNGCKKEWENLDDLPCF